ncbi:MAG TPA: glycosyltransferase family 4 protein [Phycisphaerae bacterium]|nr:glycosyltransferase family 4 protein [Phycisphaerae bacterium]
MRILLTVHQFLPDHISGTEVIALRIAQELQHRGHDVHVFTGYPSKEALPEEKRFDSYSYENLRVRRFLHSHVPMGQQNNIVEMEYRHEFFKRYFKKYLQDLKPDVVHFIHLFRLSTTAIDACRELGIPTVFTATDFWFVCPLIQLRLPDGALCKGPNAVASNCVRHVALVSQPPNVVQKVTKTPFWLLTLYTWAVKKRIAPKRWYTPYIEATTDRPGYMRKKINQIDRVLVPSHTMEKMLQAHGLEKQRTLYLPYGIKIDHIQRHTDKGSAATLRLAFVGTLVEHKGAHVLIEAFKQLPPDLPVTLTLHGKLDEFPPYVAKLRAMIGNNEKIKLAGPFAQSEVSKILGETDVLVCPSIWYENTPLVISEAQAAGVPVVASNLGGMAEAIDVGANGLVFEAGNATALAEALRTLAIDREMVRRFSRKTPLPMSVPDHVTRLEAVYTSLLPVSTVP